MTTILLPASVDEGSLERFLLVISQPTDERVDVDFLHVRFFIPGALVALLACIHKWVSVQKTVTLVNASKCPAFQYLQRFDFFHQCGIPLDETFTRRDSTGRFVPIKAIGRGGRVDVGEVSTEIARCVAPELAESWDPEETGLFDFVEYSISELATNVIQHSGGAGFIAAQVNDQSDTVRIGIADCGIGILESFARNGSPHWYAGMTDFRAICKAMEPQVSCRSHLKTAWGQSINAGVGLTLLKSLATALRGTFCVASYTGFFQSVGTRTRGISWTYEPPFEGTLCAISFPRTRVTQFATMLDEAKFTNGLIRRDGDFREMFS